MCEINNNECEGIINFYKKVRYGNTNLKNYIMKWMMFYTLWEIIKNIKFYIFCVLAA